MKLGALRTSLLRRWYLTMAALVAAGALTVLTASFVTPTYTASASVVLLPPASSLEDGGNPYLSLGGLSQTVDVVTRALTSDATRKEIAAAVPDGAYEAAPDWSTSGPILTLDASGPTQRATMDTLEAVLAQVPTTLSTLQDQLGVANNAQITSTPLAVDEEPEAVQQTRMRATVAAGAVALIGGTMLIGAIDGLLLRRKARKEAAALAAAALAAEAAEAGSDDVEPPKTPEPADRGEHPARPEHAARTARTARVPRRPRAPREASARETEAELAEEPELDDASGTLVPQPQTVPDPLESWLFGPSERPAER
ncbi:hypothetical protein AGMMS50218_09890 [Actinomycetota bacterium]|nr:hypothetical protein AGMMS50218_09890 [Actinomycetota bacterium]